MLSLKKYSFLVFKGECIFFRYGNISTENLTEYFCEKYIFPPFSRIFSFRIAQFYFENKILQIYADVLKSFISETDIKKSILSVYKIFIFFDRMKKALYVAATEFIEMFK